MTVLWDVHYLRLDGCFGLWSVSFSRDTFFWNSWPSTSVLLMDLTVILRKLIRSLSPLPTPQIFSLTEVRFVEMFRERGRQRESIFTIIVTMDRLCTQMHQFDLLLSALFVHTATITSTALTSTAAKGNSLRHTCVSDWREKQENCWW